MAISFLLVGYGRIGMRHAAIVAAQAKLLAVCDINPEKSKVAEKTYGTNSFTDYNQMLLSHPGADAVVVCTPNGLHASQSISALEKGFHVVCEKPMAITSADCRLMMNAAGRANKKLFVVKQNRFNPPVVEIKKILDENRLGKILSFQLSCFWNRDNSYYEGSWKGTLAMDGGTLYTQFSHFIDLLYWMLGDIKTVTALTRNANHKCTIEFEDTGAVLVELESGAIGTINYTVNACRQNMEGSLTIFGEKGTVKIGGQYLNELDYQCIEDYVIPPLKKGNGANGYGAYQGSMSNHAEVYQQVIAALEQDDGSFTTNSFEALKTVEIIEHIYESANTNNSH